MIQQGLTNSFKQEMLQAGQNLATDTLRMALYTAFSDIGPETTAYTTSNEVTGTGYTAGGELVTGATISTDTQTGTVYVNFDNVSWPGANFTATNNTVTMPANTATTALIRFP